MCKAPQLPSKNQLGNMYGVAKSQTRLSDLHFQPLPLGPPTPLRACSLLTTLGGVFWGFSLKEISWQETLD